MTRSALAPVSLSATCGGSLFTLVVGGIIAMVRGV